MKNKLITITAILLGLCAENCIAAVSQAKYEKNSSSNTIAVTGTASEGEQVSVHIVKNTEINDNNIKDNVVYISQSEAASDGEFCFVAEVLESGEYNIFVSSEDLSSDSVKMSVDFYNSTDYSEIIKQLNDAKNEDEFCEIIINNTAKLGFDDEINRIIDLNKTGKVIYSGLKGKEMSVDSYSDNIDYYKNCAMMIASNEGKLTSIKDYAGNIIKANKKLYKYWSQYITSVEKEKFAIEKLAKININNVNDLENDISEVLILTATYYPDGYMSLKDLYSDFKDILGLNSVSTSSSIYKNLAGSDFDNVKELVTAYKNAMSTSNSVGGNSGGGSGGSGGNSGGSKISMSNSSITEIPVVENKSENTDEIPLKFIDLGSVRWAYPSISVLFDLGIVSGVNENEFLPEKNVKREEFTKMLVVALNENTQEYTSEFSDVNEEAWYATYVGCAFAKGIVNGVSATEFGVSKNITRQDMAVMIYRAMLSKGFEKTSSYSEFADNENIADYAKEAVSELSEAGIINGVGDNMFAPQKYATRAEAAVIIERALQYLR